jgi:hypothetical protein
MEKYFKSEKELLQGIIDRDGDCIDASWCIMCPFANICVSSAIKSAKLLPKEERVKRAFDKLFNEMIEEELDNGQIDPDEKTT